MSESEKYEREMFRLRTCPSSEVLDVKDDSLLISTIDARLPRKKDGSSALARQSGPQTVVSLVATLDGIVGNGGLGYLFEGYFSGDPDYALTRHALRIIGADTFAQVFDEVFSIFEATGGPPADLRVRHLTYLAVASEVRAAWDERLFASMEDLERKLAAYIRSNRGAFVRLPPSPPIR